MRSASGRLCAPRTVHLRAGPNEAYPARGHAVSTGEPAVMANKRFTLSPEQLRAFSDQGLLKVDFGFDPQLLDQIITEVRPLYGTAYEEDPLAAIRCQDGWKEVDAVRQLAVHDSVLAALRMLLDREPLPFQTLNFPVGTSQYSHSDSIHFHTIGRL